MDTKLIEKLINVINIYYFLSLLTLLLNFYLIGI